MRCFLFSSRLALTLSCFGKKKLDCDLATSSHSSWNLKVPSSQPTLIRVGGIKINEFILFSSRFALTLQRRIEKTRQDIFVEE